MGVCVPYNVCVCMCLCLLIHFFFFYHSSETESSTVNSTILPLAKLIPDEKDTEVHQENSARDCQVFAFFALNKDKFCY